MKSRSVKFAQKISEVIVSSSFSMRFVPGIPQPAFPVLKKQSSSPNLSRAHLFLTLFCRSIIAESSSRSFSLQTQMIISGLKNSGTMTLWDRISFHSLKRPWGALISSSPPEIRVISRYPILSETAEFLLGIKDWLQWSRISSSRLWKPVSFTDSFFGQVPQCEAKWKHSRVQQSRCQAGFHSMDMHFLWHSADDYRVSHQCNNHKIGRFW
jgi:hypothetical protein